ncbi:hypothetical protein AUK40_01515 [Candidatus Wirthbacteria bacterium CG2_30_54_11]|uniref:J domain-containing protein n=1 Tax=Candidatus Wirthbacteria bacterium CG2_30_54_11 TaxID=1817892 RepID=A0A1J5J4K1_9BACT|nr:MAG: hypothetical protein AUK40_01515 [Candidatus Wirthbacteria bacterium CG2_30_54_11]
MKNYYKILEVQKNATEDQIRDSFHLLAQKYHPDRNPGDEGAKGKFQEINEAYQTLKDPQKKTVYDFDLRKYEEQGSVPPPAAGSARPGFDDSAYKSPEYSQNGGKVRKPRKIPLWLRRILDFLQIISRLLIGAAIGAALIALRGLALGDIGSSGIVLWLWGIVSGGLLGLTLPDENQLEGVLKERFKDGYSFTKSLLSGVAGAFWGALLADTLAFQLDMPSDNAVLIGSLLGCAVIGSIANIEAFWTKLRLPRAYFELFFFTIRMIAIALILSGATMAVNAGIGLITGESALWTAGYFGGLCGLIIGTMAPSDLLAYARYASAYVGKLIVLLLILGALVIGLAGGYFGRGLIQ